jgi:molybdenum cofactor synthesis domain-containing protein
MANAEIIAIGNELLTGEVQDTNTHWLCRQITRLGGRVTRAAVVGDDTAAIAAALRAALSRRSSLILTAGGLGPTADDMTLAAVGDAAKSPLGVSEIALAMVQSAYEKFAREGYVDDAAMTASRRKMAMLPGGAEPLCNPVGAAPGVLLSLERSTVVCLPGVPEELKGIFREALGPPLCRIFGSGAFAELAVVADCGDESVLAPLLAQVAAEHPHAYIKSRPRRFGSDVRIRITISACGDSRQGADVRLRRAADDVRRALQSSRIATTAER